MERGERSVYSNKEINSLKFTVEVERTLYEVIRQKERAMIAKEYIHFRVRHVSAL
jgi:hypothetical protein